MTDQEASFFNLFTCFAGRMASWFLCGSSLGDFLTNRVMKSPIKIMVDMPMAQLAQVCLNFNVEMQKSTGAMRVSLNGTPIDIHFLSDHPEFRQDLVYASAEEMDLARKNRISLTPKGLWRCQLSEEHPYYVQLPYLYGAVMDMSQPGWFVDQEHGPRNWRGAVFFDEARKRSGAELLGLILEAGERAGIRDAMWLGFGCCLGKVRNGGFIPSDNDLDICIDSEKITREQEEKYLQEIQKPMVLNGRTYEHGLCESRFQAPSRRGEGGRALWTSIGHRSIKHDNGVKACHWLWFRHGGVAWHSKGGRWVNEAKFNRAQFAYDFSKQALCLGIPESLVANMVTVDFEGVQVQIPSSSGACCDWWYPGWAKEAGGSSRKRLVMCVGQWEDPKTWTIIKA